MSTVTYDHSPLDAVYVITKCHDNLLVVSAVVNQVIVSVSATTSVTYRVSLHNETHDSYHDAADVFPSIQLALAEYEIRLAA